MKLVCMNKITLKLFLISIVFLNPFISFSQDDTRIKKNFDFDWKFKLGDNDKAASVNFDDSDWENIQLPHDWSIKTTISKGNAGPGWMAGAMGFMAGGTGWYRKEFTVPANSKGKQVSIMFDGVYHQSDVYINGKHLGFHPYGYSSFEYDLTPYLNYGEKNTISVKVNHSDCPTSRWYSGSGIYRHVWLKITNPVHVATWGTYITTPKVSKNTAEVKMATTIENSSSKEKSIKVESRILGANGKKIASKTSNVQIEQGKQTTVDQSMKFDNPMLWSIKAPNLYTMESTIKEGGKIVDQYTTNFGVRTLKFDAEKGFFLNGENFKLQGVCLHQDAGLLGTAVPDKSYLRRLQILKKYGVNAIRCSHNSPSPEFLDICDSLGLLVIDEAFDKWKNGYYKKYFDEWWQEDLDAMLLRDRNHPSIILWSIGNETGEQDKSTHEGTEVATMLRDHVHKTEPSRLVTAAIRPRPTTERYYNKTGFADSLDVVGYNYQEPWLKRDKKEFPDRIMYISEAFPYYRGRDDSFKDFNPINPWYDVANNEFMVGQFIWAGVDYLGESTNLPSTGWATCPFDVCMFEKPSAAFNRAVWNDEPMVRIAVTDQSLDIDQGRPHWSWPFLAAHWNFPQYKGHLIEVHTTTNCESVELWVNGKSLGRRKTSDYTNNTIVWKVVYAEGTIEAKGYNNGKEVTTYNLKTSGKPAQVVLTADTDHLTADGQDLSHITIQLLDDKGIPVQDSDQIVTVELSGQGKLLGVDNGDLRRVGSYSGNKIKTYFGKALAIVQSNRVPGSITVKVCTEGLPEATFAITSN